MILSELIAMHIQISKPARTRMLSNPEYRTRLRGKVNVKGKGVMDTYWLIGKAGQYDFSKYVLDNECDIPNIIGTGNDGIK